MDNSPNGESKLDRMERVLASLIESEEKNREEHDRIWRSIDALRDGQLEMTAGIKSLTGAIRDLIDRIPPENLR
jgi:hypothetical protein